ncbi:MAG: M16 family metallopeptidase [Legionella sp.]
MMNIIFSTMLLIFSVSIGYSAQLFKPQQWQTSRGAEVIYYPAMEVPMLDISIAFAAGSAFDGKHFGLSALTTRLLNQGNQGMSADIIAEQLAKTGAQYSSESNRDMSVFNLKTLTNPGALKQASDIFSTIINHPDFPQQAFIHEQNQQLTAIMREQEIPDEMATQLFSKALYGDHPYAHPINGTQESIKKIRISDVINFYKKFFVNRNAVIVIVGAIDEDTAHKLAEKLCGNLPTGEHAPNMSPAKPLNSSGTVEFNFPTTQTIIRLGQLGIDHKHPNYFPLQVGNYILGGGNLVSRLAQEVREKRGLTYGVYSQFYPMLTSGPFLISLSTRNKQKDMAIRIIRETLSNFMENNIDEQELLAAKQYLTGSFSLSLASNSSIANMLLKIAFYHLPSDFIDSYIKNINQVSAKDIKKAFQEQLNPKKLLQVTVGQS